MLIDRIRIENFLSYDVMEWDQINPGLSVIVGPNGAGKTNLINAVRAVTDTVSRRNSELWRYAAHRGATVPAYRIEIDVRWNAPWESEVLAALVAAALCDYTSVQATLGGGYPPDAHQRLSALISKRITTDWVSLLQRGRLIVQYQGMNHWQSSYEFQGHESSYNLAFGDMIGPAVYTGDPGTGRWRPIPVLVGRHSFGTPSHHRGLRKEPGDAEHGT